MQETLYQRNGRWLTSQQIVEYNKKNKPIFKVQDIISNKEIEVTQEELDSAEEITMEEARDLPIVDSIFEQTIEEELPKEVPSTTPRKKSKK